MTLILPLTKWKKYTPPIFSPALRLTNIYVDPDPAENAQMFEDNIVVDPDPAENAQML